MSILLLLFLIQDIKNPLSALQYDYQIEIFKVTLDVYFCCL